MSHDHTICAECDFLDREYAKGRGPKAWRCNAPRTRVLDFVSGKEKQPWVLCHNKNTGKCKHWCPFDTTDLMELLDIKPKKTLWYKLFWSGIVGLSVLFAMLIIDGMVNILMEVFK